MNKKGFTLIELLAVIVILAIIMLIATPLIINVINDAKKGAAKNSAMGYVDAVEKEYLIRQVKEESQLDSPLTDPSAIKMRGGYPKDVNLTISEGQVTSGTLTFGDYHFTVVNGVVDFSTGSSN